MYVIAGEGGFGACALPPAPGFREGESRYRADESHARRYRHWRGASGRSYVFSVYAPADCPAYEDAVVIVVAGDGSGELLACVDLGAAPDLSLDALRRIHCGPAVQFQIHVLSERAGDRRALIADLSARRK